MESTHFQEQQKQQRKLSIKSNPMEAIEFLHDFLMLYSTLEQAKDDWACRKLGIADLKTSKQYHAFVYVSGIIHAISLLYSLNLYL